MHFAQRGETIELHQRRPTMFRNILTATDGSPTAMRAVRTAVALAAEQKAVLHVVHVLEPVRAALIGESGLRVPKDYLDTLLEAQRKAGRKVLGKAEALARKQGVTVNAVLTRFDGLTVAHAILREARRLKAELIIVGTHGRRGLSRLLTGSDAEALLREAPVPVLLVRDRSARKRVEPRASRARKGAKSAAPATLDRRRHFPVTGPWL
jgi:nucleotide-binding universal stress UspA family protein